MSLSSKTELARALFRSTPPDSVTRISGTATADSSDGTVTVQLEDGDVIEVGTIGSVSAGDTVTIHVQRGEAQVIASEGWGDAMQAAVDEATAIAEATGQHFWHDSNGAHVTEVTADQWAQSQTGHNILVNSLGILLRKALNYIAAWTGSAISFYDGNGNAASNVTATFGSSGFQVGKTAASHLVGSTTGLELVDSSERTYFKAADMSGSRFTDTFVGDGSTISFYLSIPLIGLDPLSGMNTTVEIDGAVVPTGSYYVSSILNPDNTTTSMVTFYTSSVPAQGADISISYTVVAGYVDMYTLGQRNTTVASGAMSVASGYWTGAEGFASNAQNRGTIAQGNDQTAMGRYNVADSTSALIVGNGTSDNARSNALTVDWSGNVEAAGGLSLYGGTAFEGMFHLATKSTTIGAVSANGGTKTLSMDASLTGYAPIAISGWYVNGASRLHPYMLRLYSGNVQVYLCNNASSASSSSATIEVQVLYVKTA